MVNGVFNNLGFDSFNALSGGFGAGNPFEGDISQLPTKDIGSSLLDGVLSFVPGGGIASGLLGGLMNMGRSHHTKFTQHANFYASKYLPSLIQSYGSDLSGLFTKISETVYYMESFYQGYVNDSTGANSIKGNGNGLKQIKSVIQEFKKMESKLSSTHDIKKTSKSKTISKKQTFIDGVEASKFPVSFNYHVYDIKEKVNNVVNSDVVLETRVVDGVETVVPVVKKSFNPLLLLLALPFGLIVWLISKIKN